MTRYLRISGLCFSLAVIVTLLGFTSAFAESNHNSTRSNTAKPQKSERQIQPNPKPVEATTVKGSKSNTSERQIQPNPKPAEATTVKSSKSNSSE